MVDTVDDGMQRTAAQKWTRDRMGPAYRNPKTTCAGCDHDETEHAWPRDPAAVADPRTEAVPALVGEWPPGTARGHCRLKACRCPRFDPRPEHKTAVRRALEKPDPHSGPLPAYLRRPTKGPRAWQTEKPIAAGPLYAPGGMG